MAIVTHTFIDKSNTIIEGDCVNVGLNPILELYYGSPVSRGLIHFDTDKLTNLVKDCTYPDITKLHHRLKMKNVGGLSSKYDSRFNKYNNAERAVSFDLIFFLINKDWDMGRGFDYIKDGYDNEPHKCYSKQGSNWFNATNVEKWDYNGVYSREMLENNHNLIIARQHFDKGNESIDVDLTDVVNDMIVGKIENYGIGICFDMEYETSNPTELQYVGFFTDHTHTFFHPYLETTYDDYIQDDRTNFYLDKDNRLYFYANVGSKMVNLDTLPTCVINNAPVTVKQATKGVYYVDVNFSSDNYEPETMYYDIWSNLKYNGKMIPDKELYFTTKSNEMFFNLGLPYETKRVEKIIPSVFGINHKEQIERGDVRKVHVDAKIAYTSNQQYLVDCLEYKVYSKSSNDIEIDVIDWTPVERGYNENYFLINTNELPIGRYFIGIKISKDMEDIIHKELCEFEILDNKFEMKN